MTLAISVTQAGPGPIRGLAPAASHLRRPRPVEAARVTPRTADMAEERAASGSPLRDPRGCDWQNIPLAGQALSTLFHKYGNVTLTHRFAVPPLPKGEGCNCQGPGTVGTDQPSPVGRGGDREAVGEGGIIRSRISETTDLGRQLGQKWKNGGTNPSNSFILINMTQKTNLEQT